MELWINILLSLSIDKQMKFIMATYMIMILISFDLQLITIKFLLVIYPFYYLGRYEPKQTT